MTYIGLVLGFCIGIITAALFFKSRNQKREALYAMNTESLQRQLEDKRRVLNAFLDISLRSASDQSNKMTGTLNELFEHNTASAQNNAASLDDIAKMVTQSKDQIAQLFAEVRTLQQVTSDSTANASELSEVLTQFKETTARMSLLQEEMQAIQEKTSTIKIIGQEAEMLALNAAIEAARAGDFGRGFAVVADSMKELAKSSQSMTHEIENVLNQSHQDITSITGDIQTRSDHLMINTQSLLKTYHEVTSEIEKVGQQMQQLDDDYQQTLAYVTKETEVARSSMESMIREFSVAVGEISGMHITDLSPADARKKLREFDYLIDVRRANEYNDELGHIDGTQLLTLQTDFPDAIKTMPKDKKYLFICRSGGRSTKAAQQALMANIGQVYNLDGGMLAWRKAGF